MLLFACKSHQRLLKATSESCPEQPKGEQVAVIVPEVNAEYPGGFSEMMKYIQNNVTSHISITQQDAALFRAPVVQWVIDESGLVTNVQIIKTSNVSGIDKLLLDAIWNMPAWKPAENTGRKVKQDFRIPLRICFK